MAQWINVFRNNSFVNLTQLPLLCRDSRAVALSELGLTAAWLAGWLADRRNAGKFQNFKIHYTVDRIFILFAAFNKVTALLEQ